MGSTSDIRKGLTIEFNNDIYSIVDFLHVKPGKGPAFVRTKLKSVTTGKVLDNTFPSGHKLEIIRVERRQYQYLYEDGDAMVFMNTETYEQMPVQKFKIPAQNLLKEGDMVDLVINSADEMILSVDPPATVVLEISYTEPGIKGDTATNTMKPATVETGAEVRVPLFINIGDKIKVNTEDGSYMERVKE
ncbi:MAG: elongation factor P [Bacteroidia bacterium]|nr:elongation factor P [Bacteroidia bacterium]